MTQRKPRYSFLYLAVLLLALHNAFTIYINSSFLEKFFDANTISNLYMAGSVLTIFCLLLSGRFLKWFGNWQLILAGLGIEIIALLTLAFSKNPAAITFAFIAHQALPVLLIFGLDIFFEGTLENRQDAEKVRSYYLTFINSAFVIAPISVGLLVIGNSFANVYALSAVFLAILWFLIFDVFRHTHPSRYRNTEIVSSFKKFLDHKSLTDIFFLNFLLQCFYVIMIIFMAPYLHETVGLSWPEIGIIFTIMLLPFVIFEAPLGKLFNRYHDEKEILVVGFLMMSVSVSLMTLVHTPNVLLWAALLFASRVGASFVEVASEAAFYKRVTAEDASFMSIFRLTVPIAYILMTFMAGLIVPALPVTVLLSILGLILLVGMSASYYLPSSLSRSITFVE